MIEVKGLRFAYGGAHARAEAPRPAFTLEIPALEIRAGEIVACIGPSGAGKTTLLHLIAGVLVPSAGTISVLGTEVSGLPEARRRAFRLARLGMVFQEFELLEYLSARENVLLSARAAEAGARPRAGAEQLALEAEGLARAAGVLELLPRKPRRLSQGERQRVALCRALLGGPRLILCDEPTGNLDPASTARVLDLLLSSARETRATLLMVTHNHALLPRFQRVIDVADFAKRGIA